MNVVAHGNVEEYCVAHGMVIVDHYDGKIEDYHGPGLILVTDDCECKNEYYYLKYKLLKRKITLLSTHWEDSLLKGFVEYVTARERSRNHRGRARFGFKVNGDVDPENMAVVDRILELRDSGATMKKIQETVTYLDGRKIPMSTIQLILNNREMYRHDTD